MLKIRKRLQAYFLTGLLIALPMVISVTVLGWMFVKISDAVFPVLPLPRIYLHKPETLIFFRVIAVLFLFGMVTFIGFFATNVAGKKLLRFSESLLVKIPFFNKIYLGAKQISQAFFGKKENLFKQVVAFEYPRKGIYSVGFLSGNASSRLFPALREKPHVNIFLPTVPNPTSGVFMLVPKEDVVPLPMSVEEGFKMVISGGAVLPEHLDDTANNKEDLVNEDN